MDYYWCSSNPIIYVVTTSSSNWFRMCVSQTYDVGFKSHRGHMIRLFLYKLSLRWLTINELDDELEQWQIENHKTGYDDQWTNSILDALDNEYRRRKLLKPC